MDSPARRIATTFLTLIEETGTPLAHIARNAGIKYATLHRKLHHEPQHLNFNETVAIAHTLRVDVAKVIAKAVK